jgi:hypothetical protein
VAKFLLPFPYTAYSSTLKMESIYFSETPVDFQRATRRLYTRRWYLSKQLVRKPQTLQESLELVESHKENSLP